MQLLDTPITIAIIAITSFLSIAAFNNSELKYKTLFYPYKVKRNNEFHRFFSHFFIHGDYLHLIFNMFVLYSFGSLIEYTFKVQYGHIEGSVHYILLYILGGLVASVLPYWRNKDNPNYMSLGASGAVASILFASILWYPEGGIQLFFIPFSIPAWLFGILYLFFEYYMSKKGQSNIAHDAHFGGAIFGVIYIMMIDFDVVLQFWNYILNII